MCIRDRSKIRQATEAKIFLGHDPLLAKTPEEIQFSLGVTTDSHGQQLYDDAFGLIENIIAELGAVEFIRQPKHTLVRNCATKMHFTQGSQRLRIDNNTINQERAFHSENDNTHMNEEYGVAYLNNFFNHVAA